MIKYKQINSLNGSIEYLYTVNDYESAGSVLINTNTGEEVVSVSSDNDIGNRYAFKLINYLKALLEQGNLKKEGTLIWY